MQPAENVRDELWLGPDVPVTWTRDMSLPFSPEELLRPVEVGHILDGGWGCRVYAGMTPATKASSWGPAGRTHLVAQQRRGQWYARRLGAEEVARIFDPDGLMKVAADDPEQQVAEFGNSGPSRMVPTIVRPVRFPPAAKSPPASPSATPGGSPPPATPTVRTRLFLPSQSRPAPLFAAGGLALTIIPCPPSSHILLLQPCSAQPSKPYLHVW